MKINQRAGKLAAVLFAGALALSACSAQPEQPKPSGSSDSPGTENGAEAPAVELVLGVGVEPQSLDPAQSREAQFVQYFQPVFDTLIRRLPDGSPGEMLATAWEYDETNTKLTLTLREGVKFTDGTDFNADAAKANIDRFHTAGGPLSGNIGSVESTEAPDATTLVLNLSKPDPALIYNLGGPGGYMQSPEQFDSATIDTQPVGSGPYKLARDKTTPGSEYVFVANEDYWNPEIQKFSGITLKVMQDENARINALSTNQIDGMIATSKTVAQAESLDLTVNTVPGDWQGLTLLDRDGTVVPALKEVKVRQAINHAIDREAVLANIGLGFGEITTQIFSPASAAFVAELDEKYPYDVEKAKELLAEAGFADGFDWKMPSSSDMDPAVAPAVRDQLAKIGINVEWVDVPAAQYQPEQQSGTYGGAFTAFSQAVIPWSNISLLVAPTGPWNVFNNEDPEVAALLTEILDAQGDAIGTPYKVLNEYLVENAWFNPWYRIAQPYYTSDKVTVEMQSGQPVPSIYNYAPAN